MSPATPEQLQAVADAAAEKTAKRITGEMKQLGDEHEDQTPAPQRRPARTLMGMSVPVAVVVSLLVGAVGGAVSLGVAWGGNGKTIEAQGKAIDELKAEVATKADKQSAQDRETRLRATESATAAIKAANDAQHQALGGKIDDAKAAVAEVKSDVEKLKAGQAELLRKVDQLLKR